MLDLDNEFFILSPLIDNQIDETVLSAAKTHLRGVCGSSLDKFKGENYEVCILSGCSLAYMQLGGP